MGLVGVLRLGAVALLDVGVIVPRLAVAVEDLHHAHAAFDQPPRGEAGVGEVALAVGVANLHAARG